MNTEKNTAAQQSQLKTIIKALDSKRAEDIQLIGIRDLTIVADYFVIANGTSNTHTKALADEVEFLTPQGHHSGTDGFGAPTGEAQSGYTEAVSKGSGGADYAQKPHNDYGGFTEVDDDELPF